MEFLWCFEGGNYFEPGNTKTHWVNSDINIENLSRGGIHKPSVQAEVLQNSQEVEFTNKVTGKNIAKLSRGRIYKTSVQAEVLQNAQQVRFINQYYR